MENLLTRLNKVEEDFNKLKSTTTIPYEVEQAFRARLSNLQTELPDGMEDAPLAAISNPSGGATIDSEARTAINLIINRLEDLGLINT
jgi:hypothetical protein